MTETSYSIDETKLMMKLERYKRRWKEQRHYSEYLKCKLAKKALQNHELKERLAGYENNGWMSYKDAEIEHLNNCLVDVKQMNAKLVDEADQKDAEIERLNGWLDELIKQGNKGNMPYELWKREWNEIVARIQKERE